MGKSIKETMQEFTVNQALNYLEGNPEENIPKLMAFVDRLMPKDWYTSQRNAIRRSIEEKNNWYQLILRLYELDPGVRRAFFQNFITLQYPVGDPAGSHDGVQSELYRLLGGGVWTPV